MDSMYTYYIDIYIHLIGIFILQVIYRILLGEEHTKKKNTYNQEILSTFYMPGTL